MVSFSNFPQFVLIRTIQAKEKTYGTSSHTPTHTSTKTTSTETSPATLNHKWEEDVKNLKYLGVDYYRFSLSWARILPTGFVDYINPAGIAYYNKLIDALLENGIEPMVTIYHFDMSQRVSDLGGASSSTVIQYMSDFARVAFENFGDRVKYWITYNEPKNVCLKGDGLGSVMTVPETAGIGEYLCSYNVLRSHAAVYHMYNEEFREKQGGKIGMTLDTHWYEPVTDSEEDIAAQQRRLHFTVRQPPLPQNLSEN